MYLRYGGYTHALDEATVAITNDVERDANGLPSRVIIQWSIRGLIQADDQAALLVAIAALEAAYAADGYDIALLLNDASTVAHQILTASTDGGVKVVRRPSFPVGDGAELSTFRSYEIMVAAEQAFTERLGAILEYQETLTFSGGGPRFQLLELRNGPPQLQLISQQTPYTATQVGSAIGFNTWPDRPAPYWASPVFDQPGSSGSFGTPKKYGEGTSRRYREYPVSWSYSFISDRPLAGRPVRKD